MDEKLPYPCLGRITSYQQVQKPVTIPIQEFVY